MAACSGGWPSLSSSRAARACARARARGPIDSSTASRTSGWRKPQRLARQEDPRASGRVRGDTRAPLVEVGQRRAASQRYVIAENGRCPGEFPSRRIDPAKRHLHAMTDRRRRDRAQHTKRIVDGGKPCRGERVGQFAHVQRVARGQPLGLGNQPLLPSAPDRAGQQHADRRAAQRARSDYRQ